MRRLIFQPTLKKHRKHRQRLTFNGSHLIRRKVPCDFILAFDVFFSEIIPLYSPCLTALCTFCKLRIYKIAVWKRVLVFCSPHIFSLFTVSFAFIITLTYVLFQLLVAFLTILFISFFILYFIFLLFFIVLICCCLFSISVALFLYYSIKRSLLNM